MKAMWSVGAMVCAEAERDDLLAACWVELRLELRKEPAVALGAELGAMARLESARVEWVAINKYQTE